MASPKLNLLDLANAHRQECPSAQLRASLCHRVFSQIHGMTGVGTALRRGHDVSCPYSARRSARPGGDVTDGSGCHAIWRPEGRRYIKRDFVRRRGASRRLLKKSPGCDSEHSEEPAFRQNPRKKQIPRAKTTLGMTTSGVFQHPASVPSH